MEERAVTEVLDEVIALDERRHADPLRALVAHRRDPGEIADAVGVHEHHHRVAADAAADQRALGHLGGGVVRAARAEVRHASRGDAG